MHFGLKFTAATALLALASAPALGAAISAATSGQWSATGTWSGGVVPVAGDDVTIGAGKIVTISSSYAAAADSVTVQFVSQASYGQLVIQAGSLTLHSTSTSSSVAAPQGIQLADASALLTFSGAGTHTITGSGSGSIDMAHPGAEITVPSSMTFSLSTIPLAGEGLINGPGTFSLTSGADVVADQPSGVLQLMSDLVLADASATTEWKATASGAVLQFDRDASGLAGNFQVDNCAQLKFLGDVVTSGQFKFDHGSVLIFDAADDGSFQYSSFSSSGSCGNPVGGGSPWLLATPNTYTCGTCP